MLLAIEVRIRQKTPFFFIFRDFQRYYLMHNTVTPRNGDFERAFQLDSVSSVLSRGVEETEGGAFP